MKIEQMKFNCKESCDSSPAKEMIRDLNVAFGKGDVEGILDKCTDDVTWTMKAGKEHNGLSAVAAELESMRAYIVSELTVENIITNGARAACNGSFVMHAGGERYDFCDIYELEISGEKPQIRKMISYVKKI